MDSVIPGLAPTERIANALEEIASHLNYMSQESRKQAHAPDAVTGSLLTQADADEFRRYDEGLGDDGMPL